jgi:hypothetical protein
MDALFTQQFIVEAGQNGNLTSVVNKQSPFYQIGIQVLTGKNLSPSLILIMIILTLLFEYSPKLLKSKSQIPILPGRYYT